jgi:hypothetical protein
MLHSFIQKSKILFGVKSESPVPENEICSQPLEQSLEATEKSCQSSVLNEELLKRNEDLRDAIYGNVIS